MATMPDPRVLADVLRAGHLRARVRAGRDGLAAVRLQLVAAALDVGLLDALADGPSTTEELAGRLDLADRDLLGPFLRVLAAAGLVAGDGPWRLTRAGRAVVVDDVVRATYEGFGGYHGALYRDLPLQLRGGPPRLDTVHDAELVARLSAAVHPLVRSVVVRTVTRRRPRRVLDVGCGSGLLLAVMLEAAPDATGTGVDADARAAALARRTLDARGLGGRARVEAVDVRDALGRPGEPDVDLALLADVVHQVPVEERAAVLRAVAGSLSPGGAVLVVTTTAGPPLFSRHLDLLLRAQEGRLALPTVDDLLVLLREAGLQPGRPEQVGPRAAALTAVTAVRPQRPTSSASATSR